MDDRSRDTDQRDDDKSYKNKTFKRLIVRFADKTSMQGVPYINNAKLLGARIIWTILLLAAMAAMCLHLWYLSDQFNNFPYTAKVTFGFGNLRLPEITICNTNPIHSGRLAEFDGADELKRLIEDMRPENLAPEQFDDDLFFSMFSDYYYDDNGQNIYNQSALDGVMQTDEDEYSGFDPASYDSEYNNWWDEDSKEFDDYEYDGAIDTQARLQEVFESLYMELNAADREYLGHSIDDMLLTCSFNGRLCNSSMFRLFQSPRYGNCWTLSNDRFTVQQSGPSGALSMTPLLVSTRYLTGVTQGYGIQMEFHEPGSYPDPYDVVYDTITGVYTVPDWCNPGIWYTDGVSRTRIISRSLRVRFHSLSMTLFLESTRYLTGVTQGYGIQMEVHEPGSYPDPYESGFLVPASMETSIGLRMIKIERIGKPHSNCEPGGSFRALYNKTYTRRACRQFCEVTTALQQCGCYDEDWDEIVRATQTTLPECNTEAQWNCINRIVRQFEQKTLSCNCLNPCVEVTYNKEISSRQWPNDGYSRILLKQVCDRDFDECVQVRNDSGTDYQLRNNFLKLNIFYEDLNFEKITEEADIENAQFLSDIGGAVGLWIGLSILSLCEVIQLIIEIIDLAAYRCCRAGRQKDRRLERNGRHRDNKDYSSSNGGPYSDRNGRGIYPKDDPYSHMRGDKYLYDYPSQFTDDRHSRYGRTSDIRPHSDEGSRRDRRH